MREPHDSAETPQAGREASVAELRLLHGAIRHSAHHMAVYDADERLVAWSLNYEWFHKPVFDALRAEGRLEVVTFPEFVERTLARQYGPDTLPEQVALRIAAHRRADGAPREQFIPGKGWYHITKMRIPSGGVMTVGVDITTLKAKEAELEAARAAAEAANDARAAFLANMSHEFRTPLNGVLGVAGLLEATALDARQAELLKVLKRSAGALLTLVDDVLDLSMIESGGVDLHLEPVRPAKVLDEVAALLAPSVDAGRVALETRADAAAGEAMLADPVRLRQLFWNLIGNAIKFTEDGRIEAALSARPEGGRIRLTGAIEDTGPGVPEAEREAIFERFRQSGGPGRRRPPGAGLGLAICRNIVEAMGGAIGVEAGAAGGARFRFTLLLDPAAPAAALDEGETGA